MLNAAKFGALGGLAYVGARIAVQNWYYGECLKTGRKPMDILSLLLFVFGIALVGFLTNPAKPSATGRSDWRHVIPNSVLMISLVSSPMLGMSCAKALGFEFSAEAALGFSWVGVFLTLPSALFAARLLGQDYYATYWAYIEASSKNGARRLVVLWLVLVAVAFVAGMIALSGIERRQ